MDRRDNERRRQVSSEVSSDWSQARIVDVAEVLHGLSSAEAVAIMGMTEDKTYARGMCIFNLGDRQQGIFLVKKGLIEEFRLNENGNRLPINRLGAGKLFGLSSVKGHYCCFAEAIEESIVGSLSFQSLEELCRKFPKATANLIGILTQRLGEIEDRLELVAFSVLRARVAWALLSLHAIHGPRLGGVTHESLGAWAVSSRPKVSTILEELEQTGLLRLSRRQIEILDPAGLERWAKEVATAE